MFIELLTHPLFLTLIFAGLGVQFVKIVIFLFKYKSVHALDIVATGGMPSSHSALVSGLVTSIYLLEGLSTSFFIMLSVAFIVIVDAMGVRRTAGEEGKLLHKILKKTKLQIKEPHYALGHTPVQVSVGIVLGVVVGLLVSLL